jgi:hypothetical protein
MDITFKEHLELIPAIAKSKISELLKEVKNVNGTFVTLFHNESLSENEHWKDWKGIYQYLYEDK